MTPELLTMKVEKDIAESLARLSSADAAEVSLRRRHPAARFRAPHPVFDLSCSLLSLGLANGASGVQLTPTPNGVDVQIEVNGALQKVATLPKELQEPIVARFKDGALLDATKHAQPQTGNLPLLWQNKSFDAPISFFPTENGEQVALQFVPK